MPSTKKSQMRLNPGDLDFKLLGQPFLKMWFTHIHIP